MFSLPPRSSRICGRLSAYRLILLCATIFLVPSSVSAQITIRDTIRIGGRGETPEVVNPCVFPAPDLYIVAPRRGVLRFRGAFEEEHWGYVRFQLGSPPPIVLNQRMEFTHQDTTYTRWFTPIASSWTTEAGWSQAGNHCIGSQPVLWYRGLLKLDSIYTDMLEAGDTLRFRFIANLLGRAQHLTELLPEQWLVRLYPESTCYSTPPPPFFYCFSEEEAGFYVEYADTLVRFTRPDSLNVYPYYPAIRNDTVTVGAKKRFVDLEVTVQFGDSLLRNYPVRVLAPTLVDSGGHSHGGARPMGRYRVRNTAGNGFDTLSTFTRNTDSTGVLKFRYLASQFGGVERIRARLVSDTTRFDTLSLITRVPGLVLLPESNHYIKIGGTCRHHGPSDNSAVPDSCRSPDNNHWGTNRLVQAIHAIASAYDSLHRRVRLRVNDMSLPYGGLFDIAGNWLPSHHEHRIGINADFSLKCRDSTNNLVDLKEEDFSRITWNRTGLEPLRHYPPEQPHYHIYVRED